ncbi:galanin receptor type 1-like [Montipora capricornis]
MNYSTADPPLSGHDTVYSAGFNETKWLDILQFSLFAITFIVSVSGNTLVCLVVALTARMRTTRNYLLVNLAVADLTVALLCIPFDVVIKIKSPKWLLGRVMCKLLWPSMTLVTNSSAATLAVISYDRYRAVIRPRKSRFTTRQTGIIIALIWMVSLLLVLPYVKALTVKNDKCYEVWHSDSVRKAYTLGLFVFQYALPLTIITVAYCRVVTRLRSQAIRMARNYEIMMKIPPSPLIQDSCTVEGENHLAEERSDNTSSTISATPNKASKMEMMSPEEKWFKGGNHLKAQTENKQSPPPRIMLHTPKKRQQLLLACENSEAGQKEARRIERNTKIIKMLVSVVFSYAVCFLPNQVVWLWCELGDGCRWRYINELFIFSSIMVYINSSVNPVLYAGMNAEFRKGFGRILRCQFGERPPEQV